MSRGEAEELLIAALHDPGLRYTAGTQDFWNAVDRYADVRHSRGDSSMTQAKAEDLLIEATGDPGLRWTTSPGTPEFWEAVDRYADLRHERALRPSVAQRQSQTLLDSLEAARQAHVRAELACDYIGGVVSLLEELYGVE